MNQFTIRDCVTIDDFDNCVRLQREAFGLPELEISPRRHLIVSRQAGGWTLGAFLENGELIGFVHHLAAVRGEDEIIGYSHMMAVSKRYQNLGIGARLKWAQRDRALGEGRRFIKWTWDPMQARNAHFNLNRLGAIVESYAENFYGTDYITEPEQRVDGVSGIDSDRLFANWYLRSPRVTELARGIVAESTREPVARIEIPGDWSGLLRSDAAKAKQELLRVRTEFKQALGSGLVCAGFERDRPAYLLYEREGEA
jgi:predicted GNAT superfamily acetyltransferase